VLIVLGAGAVQVLRAVPRDAEPAVVRPDAAQRLAQGAGAGRVALRRVSAAGDGRRRRRQVRGARRASARDALDGRRRAGMPRQVDHDDRAPGAVPLPGRRPVQLRARLSPRPLRRPAPRRPRSSYCSCKRFIFLILSD